MAKLQTLSMQDLAVLQALVPADYPERLVEIAVSLFAYLVDNPLTHGMSRQQQAALALGQTEGLRADHGGSMFYFPAAHSYELTLRDRQMIREYTGNNVRALAIKNGLSETRVRQILAAWEAEERERRQMKLPGLNEGHA
ncbi:Mor transcription activator family protein [Ideonella sp.]|uniref:Mor transcription activator family protein n=1 Tax=Ideonella sp. TaxID=1929293 RepID=UPI003BB53986